MKKTQELITWQGLFRTGVAILVALLLIKTINTIILLIVAAMVATALYPMVKKLQRYLPLQISAILVMALLFVPFILLAATLIPQFIAELPTISRTIDSLVNSSALLPAQLRNVDFTQYVQNGAAYLFNSTGVVTQTVTSIITVIILAYYFMVDSEQLIRIFLSLFPKRRQAKIAALLNELARVNGQYIRGNLLISVICSVIIFIGLLILRVPFAGPLAIFAGILDLLPLIGSTVAMIPSVIIGFAISPLIGILVIVLFVIYQQLENAIIAPAIYNKALNLSAALSVIAVIIGSALFGIVGAFLALPIAASIPTIIAYLKDEKIWQIERD